MTDDQIVAADAAIPLRMGRPCKTCQHPDRAEIERDMAAGVPLQRIEKRFADITDKSLSHHLDECVPRAILVARAAVSINANLATFDTFKVRLESLMRVAEQSLEMAMAKGAESATGRSSALREARGCLETLGKLLGYLGPEVEIRIGESPVFLSFVRVGWRNLCQECQPKFKEALRLAEEGRTAAEA